MLRLKCYEEVPNAGDAFGRRLAEHHFSPSIAISGEAALEEANLVLLGSILHWADAHSVVCGAGLIATHVRPTAPPALISCVRGPLTSRALRGSGIACPDVFGDPGILVPELFPTRSGATVALGLVPHYADLASPWVDHCRALGIPVLDVRGPLEHFLAQLQRCDVVLSSSLHGIIFAHAYGRRALWIEISDLVHGDGFKFFDYYASIGVPSEQVTRQRISRLADPHKLASLARPADHAHLLLGLKSALQEAAAFLDRAA